MANSTASFSPSSIHSNQPNYDDMVTMWNQINDLYNIIRGTSSYSDVPAQKRYLAILHQGDSSATQSITASVVFNNTGVIPTFTRSAAGHYPITASGLFNTASVVRAYLPAPFMSGGSSASVVYAGRSGSDNYGYISTYNETASMVDQWSGLVLEIIKGHS